MAGARRRKSSNERIEPSFGPASGAFDLRVSEDDRPSPRKSRSKKKSVKSDRRDRRKKPKARRGGGSGRRSGGPFKTLRRLFYWGAVLGVWATLAVGGVLAYYATTIPDMQGLEIPKRPPSIEVRAVDGTIIGQRGKMRGHAVSLHELPRELKQAVLATEDSRFYGHFGVDVIGLARAMVANVQAGRVVQGGSTITQQLAKNMFLRPDRTMERKLQEVVLALWLEARFSKDEILEMYLNRVFLGAGSYGVEAAAQRYFGVSARSVNLQQSAILAGLLRAPSRLAPTRNPEGAEARAKVVLSRMVDEGFINRGQGEVAMTLPAKVTQARDDSMGYVADWVAEQVELFLGEVEGDVVVETTLDVNLQRMAQASLTRIMADEGAKRGAAQAALVAVDGVGAVRAMVGGVNYRASQYNRAVTAKRQPGSAFKPFVYLAAVEAGITPQSVRVDGPTEIANWRPENYAREYFGPVTLTQGLSRSLNTVAARLTQEVGVRQVTAVARRLGIISDLHDNPSISLGTGEVSVLEITGAYVPFSNGGFGVTPHIVTSVTSRDGRVLYVRQDEGFGRVVNDGPVGQMNYMMSQTITDGTGKRATLGNWPAAGKTGTSQNFKDAWFIGYTSNLTAGVWVGNDDGSPTNKASGGNVPTLIWRDFMLAAHEGLPPAPLPGTYDPRADRPGDQRFEETLPWLRGNGVREAGLQPSKPIPNVYEQPQRRNLVQRVFPIDRNFLRRIFGG
ncbi:MAG: PBP1A family penicillin-binding protein [Pseudomonadota bacterium]